VARDVEILGCRSDCPGLDTRVSQKLFGVLRNTAENMGIDSYGTGVYVMRLEKGFAHIFYLELPD